jgi:hypothetical protein
LPGEHRGQRSGGGEHSGGRRVGRPPNDGVVRQGIQASPEGGDGLVTLGVIEHKFEASPAVRQPATRQPGNQQPATGNRQPATGNTNAQPAG